MIVIYGDFHRLKRLHASARRAHDNTESYFWPALSFTAYFAASSSRFFDYAINAGDSTYEFTQMPRRQELPRRDAMISASV